MLVATSLSKRFGAKVLFDGLDWQIGRGERIGLVGDNGAGKTTLLRLLTGELTPDDGTISLTRGETLAYLPQEVPRHSAGSIRARVEGGHQELVVLGREIERLTEALGAANADSAPDLTEQLTEAHLAYAHQGGDAFAGRVESILVGLGFRREQLDAPMASLSGGWAMRVELARLLVASPNYLLMDEPTNHLDHASVAWLQTFLQNYPGTWIVVSHDHAFLNRTVERVAALVASQLITVSGTYEDYQNYVEAFRAQQAAEGAQRALRAAHLRSFIDRFGAKASKARQAKSKAKALDKLEKEPVAQAPPASRSIRMRMQVRDPSGQEVLRLEDVSFGFGKKRLYEQLKLRVERRWRIGIVGDNGAGKSTLLKLLCGELTPQKGRVVLGSRVEPYVFGQHQSEALDPTRTVQQELALAMPHANLTTLRSLLGAFLFDAHAADRQVGHLSGGEKSRLALAKMVASPANTLLLDEPTNHLDASSRAVLQQALSSYDGTLLLISHERAFMTALVDRFWHVRKDGTVHESFSMPEVDASRSRHDAAPAAAPPGQSAAQARQANKEATKLARQREKEVAKLEADIQAAEARVASIDAQLAVPEVFADAGQTRTLLAERQELAEDTLPALMDSWEKLASTA